MMLFDIVNKRVLLVMLLVLIMVFAPNFLPRGIVREEYVGLLWSIVYLSKAKTVGKRKGLLVNGSPTNYIDILIRGRIA